MDASTISTEAIIGLVVAIMGWAFTLGIYIAQHHSNIEEIKKLNAEIEKLNARQNSDIHDEDERITRNLKGVYEKLDQFPCRSNQMCIMMTSMDHRIDKLEERILACERNEQ